MSFDPYHMWLGIPPDDQPPNHYRLLGLKDGESNPDVIAHATDRQVSHVRTFQAGKHSHESQRILNELVVARAVLLDDNRRREYEKNVMSLEDTLSETPPTQANPTTPPRPEPLPSPAFVRPEPLPESEAQPILQAVSRWHFVHKGRKLGPYSLDELQRFVEQGRLRKNTLIFAEELNSPIRAVQVPGLVFHDTSASATPRDPIYASVVRLIVKNVGFSAEAIYPATTLAFDLNASELQIMKLVTELEEYFDISLSRETPTSLVSVQDYYRAIRQRI